MAAIDLLTTSVNSDVMAEIDLKVASAAAIDLVGDLVVDSDGIAATDSDVVAMAN
jgi:hypothetical protein